jgi:hypothetical protein
MLSLPCDGPRHESPGAGPDPGRLAPLSAAGPVITTRDGSQDSLIAHSTAHRNLAAASRHDDCGAKLAEVHALPSSPDTRRRDGLAGLNTARRRSGLAVHASRCGPFRIASGAADRRTRAVCKPSTTSIRRVSPATCKSCGWRWARLQLARFPVRVATAGSSARVHAARGTAAVHSPASELHLRRQARR